MTEALKIEELKARIKLWEKISKLIDDVQPLVQAAENAMKTPKGVERR